MTAARQDYRGAASALALSADMNDPSATTFAVTGDTSGWPTGASNRNFAAVIDRGTAKEEKVLCSNLTSSTVTVAIRGYDGTTAKTHSTGAAVEHYGLSADKADDLDGHVYDPTRDNHTQYMRVDGTRGFTGVALLTGTPLSIGSGANLSGSSNLLARADHVHAIEQNGIDDTGMFAPGVVGPLAYAALSIDGTTKFIAGQRPLRIVPNSAGLTAITTPTVGDEAYQQDVARLLVYSGATVGWTTPWNLPWGAPTGGMLTPGTATSSSATLADMSGASVTFTAVANRQYLFRFTSGAISSTVANDVAESAIVDGSGTLSIARGQCGTTANSGLAHGFTKTYSAGSVTVKVQVRRVTGTGTVSIGNNLFTVEDVGPNGLPS